MKWMTGVWLALSAWAAEPVDLSGAWKWHEGAGEASFARPDHDDSNWSTRMLPRGAVHLGHSWYRWRGVAPAEPGPYSLALGPFSHCFEVFLNGVSLGGTACSASGDPPFPRATAYPIPPELVAPGSTFVVALRAEGRRPSWTLAARLPDRGPYLLGATDRKSHV